MAQALADASAAMRDAESAMSRGDWSAYGEAQNRLKDALNRAEAAQAAAGAPTPSPSAAPGGGQSGS